jgi:hypothetical protein
VGGVREGGIGGALAEGIALSGCGIGDGDFAGDRRCLRD